MTKEEGKEGERGGGGKRKRVPSDKAREGRKG